MPDYTDTPGRRRERHCKQILTNRVETAPDRRRSVDKARGGAENTPPFKSVGRSVRGEYKVR